MHSLGKQLKLNKENYEISSKETAQTVSKALKKAVEDAVVAGFPPPLNLMICFTKQQAEFFFLHEYSHFKEWCVENDLQFQRCEYRKDHISLQITC
jgi:hypothetical protein